MLKNLKRAAAIVLSFAMAIQFGLANSYYVNAEEEPVEPQQEQTTTVENNSEVQEEDANEVAVPETKSVELSYVAEDGTILQAATYRDFDLNYGLNTDSSVMLNFDGYTLKDVIVNNSQTVSADQASLSVTSDLVSVQFVYKKIVIETENQTTEPCKTEEKNEDDAEADPDPETEVKEELPEYPAFDRSEMAGDVVVHATAAEGVLPRDSKLVVKRITRKAILNAVEDTVSEKNKEMDSAVALDITIQNKDGVEIQPNGSVNISFENAAVSGDEINVYHVTDDASAVTEVATNTQSFDANHFSIYVITGEKEKPLTTFNFVDAKGQIVSTQIVKTGDELITPTAPDVAGKAFVGWYDGETKFEDFNTALTITETTTRTITARYEVALYVYFLNPDGTQIMRTEKVADHKGHNYSHVSYDVDSTHKLVGWAANQNGTDDITKNIAVPEGSTSVNVYAIIKEGYWVTFDSDGGSAIDSQFVFDKISLNDQTTPTKPGYRFDGWYNGTEKVENGEIITSSMTLKAHWKAEGVNYTVIHWWENADDDGYSFHESENKTGLTGTEANAKVKSYEGFTAQPVVKKTIKGDGSTIVSVYYKRNVYDVKFYSYSISGGLFRPGKPSEEYVDLRITAKYGQDISKKWPTKSGSSTWSTTDDDYNGPFQVNIATMPLEGAKFYGPKTGYGSETAYYYVEVLPGEPSEVTKDGIRYKLDHKDTSPGTGYSVSKEDQYPLTGYTFNKNVSTRTGKSYDDAKFYYTRNTYNIKFINKGKVDKSVDKKYQQSISNENYTPARPSSLPDYYEFDGWYDNELCEGEKYVFNGKTMPAQNVTLYAKWTAKKISLTYNLNNPEGTVDKDTKNVEAGTVASTVLPSIPTINEYSFAGWYYADGNGNITSEVFHTKNTITRDTSIVGKWLYKGELRVVYDPGTEMGATVPTDDKVYAGGAKVTVAGNATTTSGMKFLGWQLNRNVYKPGQSFEVNKDIANKDNQIILTATWGDAETSTTLTYDPGNGIGTATTVDVMNNEAVEIEVHGSLGFTAPVAEGKEYYFAGWADSSTGNATYADGQTINIDANGENVLYAVWVEKTEITLVANSGTRPYNGGEQSIEGFVSTTIDGYTVSGLTAVTKGTDVGEYTNTVFDGTAMVEKDGVDVTDKVVVKTTPGTLTITKAETMTLTPELTGKDAEKEYDSKPLSGGATASVTKGTKITYSTDGGKTWSETLPSITNVGTLNVTAKAENKNYKDVTVDYTLKVTRKAVTVTADNKSKVFGEKDPELTATVTGTIGKDTVEYTLSRKAGEDVGTYTITPSGKAEQTNYKVTYATGTLTITSQSIDPGTDPEKPDPDYTGAKVNSPKDEVYDGKEHKWIPTVTDKADKKLKAGTDYIVEYSTSDFTNVGTIEVVIKGKGNYTGTVTRTYKITPKSVTVTADNKSKVFGEKDPEWTATVDGTLGNDTVDYTLTREAGEAAGKYEITVKGDKLQGNYTVTYVAGTLTITRQSIDPGTDPEKPNPDYTGAKVNSPKDEVYDGKEHKWIPTVTDKADKKLKAGTDYTVEYSTSDFTNVGTIKVTITGKGNYTGTVKRSYKVTPKEYTVTTESATKTYSGTALTAGGKVSGIVKGETVDFTITGSQTSVGTSDNTYELDWTGSAKESNYKHGKDSIGTLTVKAKSIVPDGPDTPDEKKTGITVSDPSDSKYDGKEHREVLTVQDTKKNDELVAEKDYSVTYSDDLVNAGTVTITIEGIGNYTGSFTKTYEITKRSVTLTSATASKTYDGQALTSTSITVSGDGFVEGEGATYNVTGTQTEVGNSANSFEYKLNENTLASNYDITKVVGTLTVTRDTTPVTPAPTPTTPSVPPVVQRAVPTPTPVPEEKVEEEQTPKAEPKEEEKVEEDYTPKATQEYYWALINLICAIVTVLFGLLLLISKRHKDEDDEEEDDETKQQATTNEDEEQEQEKKRGLFTRVLAVLIAIVSVVFFLVTEDMSLAWTWTDQWTIWMVVIGLVQIVVFFVGRKWKNVDNDDDDEEAQQA
uniref:MBG domain-containing protein n=2 Tax=Holdemanella biformis TaxID=1735 RepID=UPI00265F8B27|nr:MBG domain-containing protein [Holdemanella biformis]